MPNPPPASQKQMNGPLHAVPCPWCGRTNDCRRLAEALGESLEPGTSFLCDTCGNPVMITKKIPVVVLAVKQHGQQLKPIPPAQPKR